MRSYVACDVGAESGRVVAGTFAAGRVQLRELHRFANQPVRLPDGLHWDPVSILRELLHGIRKAAAEGAVAGIGVDTWGVDYGLLDSSGRLLGLPFHYRDARTAGLVGVAHRMVPRAQLYACTGIQTMPINTVFQLIAEQHSPALSRADRIALMPDLLTFWLTGRATNEATVASTTGLLDARTGDWAWEPIERLGLPRRIFGELIEPGSVIGPLLAGHVERAGVDDEIPVLAAAGHDTASAFAGVPIADAGGAAILSSGTWSLLGLELEAPVLTGRALEFNLTNERGIEGTTRLLRNVMGLWLLQQCRRAWSQGSGRAAGYELLSRLAAEAPADPPVFDPDLDELLAPADMPAAIAAACARLGQRPPRGRGQLIRSVLTSLACKYRLVLEQLEAVTGRQVSVLHVVGGGARNELLCQLTADVLGRLVLAGPDEATALGNVLIQTRANRELGSLAELREVAVASVAPRVFEPSAHPQLADETYGRFLELTGLDAMQPTTTSA